MPTPMWARVKRNKIKRARDRIAVSIFEQQGAFLHQLCSEEIERILNASALPEESKSRLRHCTKIKEEIINFEKYLSENKVEKCPYTLEWETN